MVSSLEPMRRSCRVAAVRSSIQCESRDFLTLIEGGDMPCLCGWWWHFFLYFALVFFGSTLSHELAVYCGFGRLFDSLFRLAAVASKTSWDQFVSFGDRNSLLESWICWWWRSACPAFSRLLLRLSRIWSFVTFTVGTRSVVSDTI